MKNDPFYEYRKTKILPEKCQIGMNCFLDTIDDEKIRQKVYEEIRNNPHSYSIRETATKFSESGVPVLFGVKPKYVFTMNQMIPEYRQKGYTIPKKGLIGLMLEKPDMELTFFEKQNDGSAHAVKTKVSHVGLNSDTWVIKANESLARKQYREALRYLEEAIKKEPLDARAFQNKGTVLARMGQYTEAVKCYDEVIEIAPRYIGAWLDRAKALTELKNYNEALECYNNALEINPKHKEVWDGKLDVLCELKEYKEALECVNKAIGLEPQDDRLWNNKAGLLLTIEEYKESIECCDKAININPKNAMAWSNKAVSLTALENVREAELCITKAIKLDPKIASFWKDYGVIETKWWGSDVIILIGFSILGSLGALFVALITGFILISLGELSLYGIGISIVNSFTAVFVVSLFSIYFSYFLFPKSTIAVLITILLICIIAVWITILTGRYNETFIWNWIR